MQCKWTSKSHLGPNVVAQLNDDLQWYKEREAGAYRNARGVIVTSAQMGSAAKERADARGILCFEDFAPELPPDLRALPSGEYRNREVGDWYEKQVKAWYEAHGYRVSHRGAERGRKKDGGIDLICVPY